MTQELSVHCPPSALRELNKRIRTVYVIVYVKHFGHNYYVVYRDMLMTNWLSEGKKMKAYIF